MLHHLSIHPLTLCNEAEMIRRLTLSKKESLVSVLDYINTYTDYDFYYTRDNARIFITDEKSLRQFLRECVCTFVYEERGDCKGIIAVWKSMGADVKRYTVKLTAISSKVAQDLLTILTWNFNKELFVKIRKDSKLVESCKYKGFRFVHGRGSQLLLQRKPNEFEYRAVTKEEDLNDS